MFRKRKNLQHTRRRQKRMSFKTALIEQKRRQDGGGGRREECVTDKTALSEPLNIRTEIAESSLLRYSQLFTKYFFDATLRLKTSI